MHVLLTKFVRRKFHPAGTSAISVCRPMNRDPTQPRQQVLLRLQSVEVPIQRKEDILRDFFRRAAVAENPKRNAVDTGLVPLHNVTKPISRQRDRCHG